MAEVHDKEEPFKTAVERAREFGIDISLIEEKLKLTPTQRVEAMISLLEFVEEARASRARQQNAENK